MVDGLHGGTQPMDIDAVLANPSGYFDNPADVLARPGLSHQFKLKILHQWEQDARQLAEAEAEGMGGGEDNMLARVRRAIRELDSEAADSSVHITGAEAEGIPDAGQAVAGQIEGLVDQGLGEARTAVRAKPLTAGLIALAVGFAIGRWSSPPPSRRHRQTH